MKKPAKFPAIPYKTIDALFGRIERMGKVLVNPETSQAFEDERGALYLLDKTGCPIKGEPRYGRVMVADGVIYSEPTLLSGKNIIDFLFGNDTPQIDKVEFKKAVRSIFTKSGTPNLKEIVGYTLMRYPTPGELTVNTPMELAFYKESPSSRYKPK